MPVFYLKRWTQADGRLVEFSKPYKHVVKPRRVHPKGTGFINRLYAVEGLADELAQEMERDFLSPVDSRAAQALEAMLGANGHNLTEAQRMAWSAFLGTLLARMPEDIKTLKSILKDLYETLLPRFEAIYEAYRPKTEIRPFSLLAEDTFQKMGAKTIDGIRRLMSHEKLLTGLASMEWSILSVNEARHELLTSDRPVVYSNDLVSPNSHIVLPVGPRHLFVAARSRRFIEELKAVGFDKIVEATNAAVVGSADRLVYSTSDVQLRFIQNRMGTARTASILQRAADVFKDQKATFLGDLLPAHSDTEL